MRHTLAISVAETQIALSRGVFLLSGLAIPLYRFNRIPRHTLALGVADAQIALSRGVTCFRLSSDFRKIVFGLLWLQLKGKGAQCRHKQNGRLTCAHNQHRHI